LRALFGIQSIPTLMIFRENVVVFAQPGALPEAALEDLIGQVRALDMEKVHASVAAPQTPSTPTTRVTTTSTERRRVPQRVNPFSARSVSRCASRSAIAWRLS
jgi:thioredoxin-like negative regulator of GroEL